MPIVSGFHTLRRRRPLIVRENLPVSQNISCVKIAANGKLFLVSTELISNGCLAAVLANNSFMITVIGTEREIVTDLDRSIIEEEK